MSRFFSDPPVVPRRTPEERRALRLANNDPAEEAGHHAYVAQVVGLGFVLLIVVFLIAR